MATTRNYFQKFPSISYNDYVVRDVSIRAKLTQYLLDNQLAMVPYTVKDGERADSIADFYYEDPYYAWIVYFSNAIVDPYEEWPKDGFTLNAYIEAKYGSVEKAQDEIVRYQVNWAEDSTILNPEQYNALPSECRKYWEADFGFNRQIISYHRREDDRILDSNRLDKIQVIETDYDAEEVNLQVGERIYQYNFAGDTACKSTVVGIDGSTPANTVILDANTSDVVFTSNSNVIELKSTTIVLPKTIVVGTGIPANTYITGFVNTLAATISKNTTASSNGSYTFYNPATANVVVNKVDFYPIYLASNSAYVIPSSFLTYTDQGDNYQDEKNTIKSRKTDKDLIVLSHIRLDTDAPSLSILANSHLSDSELQYWKSVDAYTAEIEQNEKRKEIVLLDKRYIQILDDSLETLLKNG